MLNTNLWWNETQINPPFAVEEKMIWKMAGVEGDKESEEDKLKQATVTRFVPCD